MNNKYWYVVETDNQMFVYKNKEDAVKKQNEMLMKYRQPTGLKTLQQGNLEEYLMGGNN